MSKSSSLTSAVAERYATSLFDLAHESKCVDAVEKELSSCLSSIESNSDLKRLVFSPVFSSVAEVVSAQKLSSAQEKELKATLKAVAGKDVSLRTTVNPDILGGLIVRLGSRQIDTSLSSKLSSLKLALKEVG